MAQRVDVVLIDDLDGGDAAETVSFALDGSEYEIDLSEENATKLRSALEPFLRSSRKAPRARRGTQGRRAGTARPTSTAAVREWARANGYTVSDRGRVPAEVQQAFDAR